MNCGLDFQCNLTKSIAQLSCVNWSVHNLFSKKFQLFLEDKILKIPVPYEMKYVNEHAWIYTLDFGYKYNINYTVVRTHGYSFLLVRTIIYRYFTIAMV